MKNITLLALLIFGVLTSELFSQQTIDQSFQFPSGGTFRKYHIYIPSSYDQNTPNKLALGFHPKNLSRWDGESWRDSLITFAEYNDLLLICPDGGTDGGMEGQVDFDFTTAVLDSMLVWYNVDVHQVFGVGFSVGAKSLYEYGLENASRFKGFIMMGAAISDASYVDHVIGNAKCKNFYLIHGDQDSPNTRYYPIKTNLESNGANVDAILMAGIGHTFDFPNRFQIMNMGFNYVDTASCDYTGISAQNAFDDLEIWPNPITTGEVLHIYWPDNGEREVIIHDERGRLIPDFIKLDSKGRAQFSTSDYEPGIYILSSDDGPNILSRKIVIAN